jgi:SAM-dependent methyltransferase
MFLHMPQLGHNKVCEVEDFACEELAKTIREIFNPNDRRAIPNFPIGVEYRKEWEIAMAVNTLKHFGALHSESMILGVGAGTESTLFYLTRFAKLLFATDLYLQNNDWSPFAPARMLWEPEAFAPFEYDHRRLVVQNMDGRFLDYPDNFFDGIFSSGSIEHFGGPQDAAYCAFEMGRVLKPGGILTLSTELCVAGPSPSLHIPGLSLFSPLEIQKYIVEASGLEPVDELSLNISQRTKNSVRSLLDCCKELEEAVRTQGDRPLVCDLTWSVYPHILLELQGHTFGSIHLALRKTDKYPIANNQWAQPTTEIIREKRWKPSFEKPSLLASMKKRLRLAATRLLSPLNNKK